MSTNVDFRNYKMTDGELCSFTSNLCNILTRDLTSLSIFGMSAPKIAALKTLGNAFELFTTDEVYLAHIIAATETKNAVIANLREEIRNMVLRCQIKWGANSSQEKALSVSNLSKLNDDSLLVTARRVHEQMTVFLSDLSGLGLTQDLLDDFEDLYQSFEDAINNQKDKVNERDIKTKERIKNGNELYDVVSNYCEIGKRVFEMSDPARYNDYIIYVTSSPGSLTAPTDLRFNFLQLKFFWEMVDNASSYQVEASTDGSNFFEIYAGSDTECAYTPIQENFMWYRARARNANGFGPYCDVLKQGYYAETLPPPSNIQIEIISGSTNSIKLSWSEVASSTNYKLFRSTVEIGSGAGTFVFISQVETNEFIETVASGHRYYYHLTAENGNQWSVISSNVFIDVA